MVQSHVHSQPRSLAISKRYLDAGAVSERVPWLQQTVTVWRAPA